MYVATRDSIKKNNRLSKVDWGIILISINNNIYRQTDSEEKSTLKLFFICNLINLISKKNF